MTADGGTKPENRGKDPVWSDHKARRALERVAQIYVKDPCAGRDVLAKVPDYELIPGEIRESIEALTDDEHRLLARFLDLADDYDIYLYSRGGSSIPGLNPVFPTGGY